MSSESSEPALIASIGGILCGILLCVWYARVSRGQDGEFSQPTQATAAPLLEESSVPTTSTAEEEAPVIVSATTPTTPTLEPTRISRPRRSSSTTSTPLRSLLIERSNTFDIHVPEHFTCAVCFLPAVPYTTLTPCGHSLCGQCANLVDNCPHCRQEISGRVHSPQMDHAIAECAKYRCRRCGWVGDAAACHAHEQQTNNCGRGGLFDDSSNRQEDVPRTLSTTIVPRPQQQQQQSMFPPPPAAITTTNDDDIDDLL